MNSNSLRDTALKLSFFSTDVLIVSFVSRFAQIVPLMRLLTVKDFGAVSLGTLSLLIDRQVRLLGPSQSLRDLSALEEQLNGV